MVAEQEAESSCLHRASQRRQTGRDERLLIPKPIPSDVLPPACLPHQAPPTPPTGDPASSTQAYGGGIHSNLHTHPTPDVFIFLVECLMCS